MVEHEHLDVLIVGAGISGIGGAVHLQDRCPDTSFAILEGRPDIGGTWDLFRYPGVRSDSDMHTLGFRFKPWKHERSIASRGRGIESCWSVLGRSVSVDGRRFYPHNWRRWDRQRAQPWVF